MAHAAEVETRQDPRARSLSAVLRHTHQNELSLSLGHGPAEYESTSWSKEIVDRVRSSTMAVYAYHMGPRPTSPRQEKQTGSKYSYDSIHAWQGSGFCVGVETERVFAGVDENGKDKYAMKTYALVQTNHHVVSGPDSNFEYSVELFDLAGGGGRAKGIRKDAEVLYRDYARDLAYIRVDISDTEFVRPLMLADPKSVHVTQEVASAGNSLGAENNFVKGTLTSEPTEVDEDDADPHTTGDPELKGMWKLSSIISPGNSGGPTVNRKGEVVGMNTASLHGHHGAPVGHAVAVEDFQVPTNHVRLFANVQRRIEPLVKSSFGGGDDAMWKSYFDKGVQIYKEETIKLYAGGTREMHQQVLNDPGMFTMLISPLIGSLIKGDHEDIQRLTECLLSLEKEFGVSLIVLDRLRQAEAESPSEAIAYAQRLAGKRDSTKLKVAMKNRALAESTRKK